MTDANLISLITTLISNCSLRKSPLVFTNLRSYFPAKSTHEFRIKKQQSFQNLLKVI